MLAWTERTRSFVVFLHSFEKGREPDHNDRHTKRKHHLAANRPTLKHCGTTTMHKMKYGTIKNVIRKNLSIEDIVGSLSEPHHFA